MLEHAKRREGKDDFINDFPWIGGKPGRRAVAFTAVWIVVLVALASLVLISFATRHLVIAIILIFVTACVGMIPAIGLIGSRI